MITPNDSGSWFWQVPRTGYYMVYKEMKYLSKGDVIEIKSLHDVSEISTHSNSPLWKVLHDETKEKYKIPTGRYQKTKPNNSNFEISDKKTEEGK